LWVFNQASAIAKRVILSGNYYIYQYVEGILAEICCGAKAAIQATVPGFLSVRHRAGMTLHRVPFARSGLSWRKFQTRHGGSHAQDLRPGALAHVPGVVVMHGIENSFEHVPVSIHVPDASAKEDWYRELNPNERIPTIDDDGFVMWESGAINLYLAEKYKSPLWTQTTQGKGRALQWGFFIANDVEPPMTTVFQNRFVFPPERRDAAVAAEADGRLRPKLAVLDTHLAANRFFGIDRWDMADFMVASVTFSLTAMNYDLSKFPKFSAWLKASLDRPGAKDAMKYRA
jgi:glutathione S-transferase